MRARSLGFDCEVCAEFGQKEKAAEDARGRF
jgi:hypothetical protein